MNTAAPSLRHRLFRHAAGLLFLAALILALHHPCLDHGLFMDDHAHYRQLGECGWSLADLTRACRLELIGGVCQIWFLPDVTLRFFRPLAFGLMKLTYVLSDWEPAALHAASLGWHLLTCALLVFLLRRLGARPLLAWAVAGLFAIHPAQVATVQWIACQTELMTTALVLAATLCYLRFRRWPAEPGANGPATRGHAGWAVAAALLFLAALGCRENAIVLPLVLLGAELPRWRRRPPGVLPLGVGLALVALLYLALRWHYLGPAGVPPKPYLFHPADPEFFRFVIDKACYYLLGLFLLAPIVPFAGLDYLQGRPLAFYGLSAAVLVLLIVVYARRERPQPRWLGPLWLLGFMAPVLPVFASPHHLYLPGVGWAITTMLILRWIGATWRPATLRRRLVMWGCVLLLGAGFGAATVSFGEVMDIAQQVEDHVAEQVVANAAGLKDGDTIYVANLPLIAHYSRLAVEERTGLRNLRVCVLTWAPRVLGLVGTDISSELTWRDERSVEIRVAGDRYFAGPLGRLLVGATGSGLPAQSPQSRRRDGFTAEVWEHDAAGVRALRFTFDAPPTRDGRHLYWGSRVAWALPLQPPTPAAAEETR